MEPDNAGDIALREIYQQYVADRESTGQLPVTRNAKEHRDQDVLGQSHVQ